MGEGLKGGTNSRHIVTLVFWEIGIYRRVLNVLTI